MAVHLNNIAPHLTPLRNEQVPSNQGVKTGSIGSTFEKMLEDTNRLQLEAEAKQTEFLTSDKKDIHGTMVAMEKADISLRLLLQVRNKLTDAYQEIIRMFQSVFEGQDAVIRGIRGPKKDKKEEKKDDKEENQ